MSRVKEKLAMSLSYASADIIPYLPDLLQDLWELGSCPEDIVRMLSGNVPGMGEKKILELACGKGAVAVRLARALGCRVRGFDLMPEFIRCAREKAEEYGAAALCEFTVEDINATVQRERGYDAAMLCAAGDVLGPPFETVCKLEKTVAPGGYVVIDDGYVEYESAVYHTRDEWHRAFAKAGVRIVAESVGDAGKLAEINAKNQRCIARRAEELAKKHPQKKAFFEAYVASQQAECDEMAGGVASVLWLLQAGA